LAQACQRRFAARGAGYSLGFTDARLGLAPMFGTAPRLAARLGREAALRLLKDASALTPAAALKAGLLDELCAADALLAEARQWVLLQAAWRQQRPAEMANAAALDSAPTDAAQAMAAAPRGFAEVARSG